VLSSNDVNRKIFRRKKAKETPRPRNSTNKPPSILLVESQRARGHTGQWACTQGSPQGNAAPRAPGKK